MCAGRRLFAAGIVLGLVGAVLIAGVALFITSQYRISIAVSASDPPTQASASEHPTSTPKSTVELDTFVRSYVAARAAFVAKARSLPRGTTLESVTSNYVNLMLAATELQRAILALPRSSLTRAWIEDGASAARALMDGYGAVAAGLGGQTGAVEKGNVLLDQARSRFRALDDKIEDALAQAGLSWFPYGGRPATP